MNPQAKLKSKGQEIVDKLNEMFDRKQINQFEIRKFKNEAEKLKQVDLPGAFTILGIIACIEKNTDDMHSSHKNAIAYSSDEDVKIVSMVQYVISLYNAELFEEAHVKSLGIYKEDPLFLSNLNMLIKITNRLDREEEFQKYVDEWKRNTGENHFSVDFPEDDEEHVDQMLDGFNSLINKHPNLLVKPDPKIVKLADELIEGVDVN